MVRRSALLLAGILLVPLALAGGTTATDPTGDETAETPVATPDVGFGSSIYYAPVPCHDASIDVTAWGITSDATTVTYSLTVLDATADATCMGEATRREHPEGMGMRTYALVLLGVGSLLVSVDADGTVYRCMYAGSYVGETWEDCQTLTHAAAFPDGRTLAYAFPIQGSTVVNGETRAWDFRGRSGNAFANTDAYVTWDGTYEGPVRLHDSVPSTPVTL